ncbi:MAG: DEAD/DEAH box helicase [Candidatus Omnitrophota bacterium]|jgi:ATP-dependent RNA helicase RhlE
MTNQTINTQTGFFGLGIAPGILDILSRIKITSPTPIQHQAIPVAIEGKDIIGVAQTGTGKTLAFAVPIIQRLAQKKGSALVLVPTRELAFQVFETFQKIAQSSGIRSAVLVGGAPMGEQVRSLKQNPRVLVATPGRLIDHLRQWNVVLDEVTILVLDEADRMLDMGFAPQIETILKFVPKDRQTMLFSATMPGEIVKIAASYMKLPVSVEIAPSGTTVEKVSQELFIVKRDDKKRLLRRLLEQYHGTVLLFCRTKFGSSKIARTIKEMGFRAAEIHSDRSLTQRREALEGFKSGKYKVLVATDIAARGIDVKNIELVINFDLPEDAQNYVHRIGRTARAGTAGHAISLATPDQGDDVRNIEKLIRTALPVTKHPDFPPERFSQSEKRPVDSRHKHGGRPSRFLHGKRNFHRK